MIVSGFTQKNVNEEPYYGSVMDHAHCVACFSRTCTAPTDSITCCEMVNCPRGCPSRYHCCKENEHVLMCPEDRVACINSVYGCPVVLHRRKIADHLSTCPASIVHCRAEWNRLHIQWCKPREEQAVLMKKTYAECGQLDTALALRDHRILVDRLLFPEQASSKFPGLLIQVQPTAPSPSSSSAADVSVDWPDRWDSTFSQLKKKASNVEVNSPLPDTHSQAATSVPSTSNQTTEGTESQGRGVDIPSGKGGSPEQDQLPHDNHADNGVCHGQALKNVISLGMMVECFARCQPKPSHSYTFVCAQDLRRDEFPHHFHAVHDRIHSDLSGWMEQRCPLAYLGCPFSFRRLRPNLPHMTVRHSWLLESFGVTMSSSQADLSHRTPSHLLSALTETADNQAMSSRDNDQVQASNGLSPSAPIERDHTAASPQNSDTEGLHASPANGRGASSVPVLNAPVTESAEILNKGPCTSPGSSGAPQGPQSAADSFSPLLDGASLEEVNASQALNSDPKPDQGTPSHSVALSGQMTGDLDQKGHVVDTAENTSQLSGPNQTGQDTGKSSALSSSEHSVSSTLDDLSRRGEPQSFTSSHKSGSVKGKPVIYTGVGASSCLYVDVTSTVSDDDREVIQSPVTQSPSTLHLEDLPSEVMYLIAQFLDSFSLYNLSLVSHSMRDLCCTLLQDRGMVSIVWTKQSLADKAIWRMVAKRWSFSTCFDPVDSWSFTGHNPIPDHLRTCPYNQDRVQHRDKFSMIPLWTSEDG